MPNPEDVEWNVLAPWIESELEAIKSGTSNTNKFASLVWESLLLFAALVSDCGVEKGLVAKWAFV